MTASPTTQPNDPVSETRLKGLVRRIHDLPSFPLVIRKLMEVAEDPDSSSRDLAEVMENDQGLSGKILKLVNSAFYSFSRPVASLQHAVTLLGYNSIRSLAMSVSVKNMFKGVDEAFDQESFWSHSLATAIGAKLLAERHRPSCKDDLFTAGLLHDIGVLLEARYLPDEMKSVVARVREDGVSVAEAEREFLGVSHPVMGAWLSQQWRLPAILQEPIARHHEAPASDAVECWTRVGLDADVQFMIVAVAVADRMAHALGYTSVGPSHPVRASEASWSPEPWLNPLVAPADARGALAELEKKFNESQDFLKA